MQQKMKNGEVLSAREEVSCRLWWKDRSKTERWLIVADILATISLLVILFVYLGVSRDLEVCTSSTCVRTAMELLNYMDVKVDPCDDFFRFSCGTFLQNTDLKDTRGSRSFADLTAEEIQNQIRTVLERPSSPQDPFDPAKKFYRACMNDSAVEAEGLNGIKQIFRETGGWPVLERDWKAEEFDWKEAVHRLRARGIYFDFFLILSVQRDKTDQTRHILSIKDPSYSPSHISENIKKMYLAYMVDMAVMFGANRERAIKDQQEVIEFLLKLAKISEEAEAPNGTETYNPLSLSELQFEFPGIPWPEYINRILAPAGEITYDDVISVSDPAYLKKLQQLLGRTGKRVIANFIAWQALQHVINYLPAKILNRAYDYLEKVNGKLTRPPRWKMCVDSAKSRLGPVISAAYVDAYFDEETRSRARTMVYAIKRRFVETLRDLDWMDDQTKDMATEKLLSSVEDIASLDDLKAESRLYEEVEVFEDQLLTSVLNLDYVNTNIRYGKLRQEARDDDFEGPEFVTGLNIVYSPKENVLRLPVGLFQGLFFQKDRPEYLDYGALGTVIAHEFYHVIVHGEHKGQPGELRSWWSSHSLLNYNQKLQCLSNSYRASMGSSVDHQVNSSTASLDEDVADLAGMKVSYDTFAQWAKENGEGALLPGLAYSPYQLFWISSAVRQCSKHSDQSVRRYVANYRQSPGQLKVEGALQNLEEFARDFGCPAGSNMNPEEKCRVW